MRINFNSCVCYQKKLWFITTHGFFMNYDIREDRYSVIVPKNIDNIHFNQVIDNMYEGNGNIYFVEQKGDVLYEYNIEDNYVFSYNLPKMNMVNWECFAGIYNYCDKLYFFSKNTNLVCVFDMKEKQVNKINYEINNEIRNSVIKENIVYLIGNKSIFSYDLLNNQYKKTVGIDTNIVKVCNYNNQIYVADESNNIYELDVRRFRLNKFFTIQDNKQSIGIMVVGNSKIFIFPSTEGRILSIDKNSKEICKENQPDDLLYNIPEWSKYYHCCEDADNIWLSNRQSNYLVFVDRKDDMLQWKKVKDAEELDLMPYLRKESVIREEDMSLRNFIKAYIEINEVKNDKTV